MARFNIEKLETRTLLSAPPLTAAQVSTSNSGANTNVICQIFDPVRGVTKQSITTYHGNVSYALATTDGFVSWTAVDSSTGTAYIGFAVYDPVPGIWKVGGESYSSGTNVHKPTVSGGVVAWWTGFSNASTATQSVRFAAYDPVAASWTISGSGSYTYQFFSGASWNVQDPVVGQGMVSWFAGFSNYPVSNSQNVGHAIFDPVSRSWSVGNDSFSNSNISGPTITGQAIRYSIGTSNYVRGYSHASGWTNSVTAPYASFFVSPSSGSPPLTTWLWDTSIGATSWGWTFGDGGSSTSQSTYHSYTGVGAFTLTHSISGPGGSHSTSAIIVTDTAPPTGSISINSNAAYAKAQAVTLNLSASDNSGNVASMRFSNDGSSWSSWQSYASTAAWTLSANDGLKTVYVQFQDPSGNGSNTFSSSINLDTAPPVVSIAAPAPGMTDGPTLVITGVGGVITGDLPAITLKIYLGSVPAGSPVQTLAANVNASGNYQVTANPLPPGQFTILAQQSDIATNTGMTSPVTIQVPAPGDANHDGIVDGGDFDTWFTHLQISNATWAQGDFNADGRVDGGDFDLWFTHLQSTLPQNLNLTASLTNSQLTESTIQHLSSDLDDSLSTKSKTKNQTSKIPVHTLIQKRHFH